MTLDLWAIGWVALLLVAALAGGAVAALAVGGWGALALLAALVPAGAPARLVVRAAPALGAYLLLAALVLAGRLDLAGAALAPLGVLLLATLLLHGDTAPAAGDWASSLGALLWAGAGALGLGGLLAFPAILRSDAVVVLGLLLAYLAGRRAGRLQGLSERVAVGVGATLAVLGSIMLAGDSSSFALVAGLLLGLAGVAYAPAPPVPGGSPGPQMAAPAWRAVATVHQHLVFVAPLTFAILWLAHTFFA